MLAHLQHWRTLCGGLAILVLLQQVLIPVARAADPVKVQNVRFEVVGTRIVVRYDLEGPCDKDYNVKVVLRREGDQSFVLVPKVVAGDVGEGPFAGKNREINWDILKEFPQGLEGDDYFFVVDVELIQTGSKLLWWLGGGAAVVGGAVFLLKNTIFPSRSPAAAPEGGFPKPVGRPAGT